MVHYSEPQHATALGVFPYFTQPDPELNRDSAGRDPLGVLPVWSEIGRGLVPCLASPVLQANGIRAVLLIHWIGDLPRFQKLLTSAARMRGFLRLMEGIVEYWLSVSDRKICFGSQALAAAGNEFKVTATSGKTVANGLHQYYRGSCQRAGLFDSNWAVEGALGALFEKVWAESATNALAQALEPVLERGKLAVDPLLAVNPQISEAFERVFEDSAIGAHLCCILGEDRHRALARTFAELRRQDLKLHERAERLASDALSVEIERMHLCEPFLLVLQDTFTILRASPGLPVSKVAAGIQHCAEPMRQRAAAFADLEGQVRSPRMRPLQKLAQLLANPGQAAMQVTMETFMFALVTYHWECMGERGRDPMVVLEGDVVVLPGGAERDADFARERLITGQPWDNDYYLNTAAIICHQLDGGQA